MYPAESRGEWKVVSGLQFELSPGTRGRFLRRPQTPCDPQTANHHNRADGESRGLGPGIRSSGEDMTLPTSFSFHSGLPHAHSLSPR
ncbi:hypothetical protein SODALDRAFT_211076 [Sodiomyces alkalinus F11]|uniref:Uncharacterized protein n=1 Tax=Sodiomyces alkalinus (strain CBS 110278 / VKM F-3762 / F11) TaxID=1314773 RepID=A0A3N2PR21_SODAK|nr:hypothetical protein SODALDRAFT_211076 [Sodiomyces alkalinus F11]ROT36935.1 hypothetical protein SODALDRAFT_211076 [Sodiomyces alkalinus F11]